VKPSAQTVYDWVEPTDTPHYWPVPSCTKEIAPKPKFYEVMNRLETREDALSKLFYRLNGFMPKQSGDLQEPDFPDGPLPFTFIPPHENKTTLEDVIGLEKPKKLFHRIIQQERRYKVFFDYINLDDPDAMKSTVLLYGPPGNGKTLLAKALAAEARGAFLNIDAARLIQTYIGTGPANIEKIKQVILRCIEPLIVIFLDEFDAVGNRMTATSGGDQERGNTINQLLTLMEGMQGLPQDKRIIFLAATNRKDLIDSALLSRFYYKIEVPNPTPAERMLHFKKHLKEKRLVPFKSDVPELKVHWPEIVHLTEGLSGRDIRNLFIQLKDQLLSDLDDDRLEELSTDGAERRRFKLIFTQPQILGCVTEQCG